MSRLISRLRHRQFGVLVTTSWVHGQAYKEIREDQHPVAVVCGSDIVKVLREHGWTTVQSVQVWLDAQFPQPSRADLGFQDVVVQLDAEAESGAR